MQITFTGVDGKQMTVTDPRRSAVAAKVTLPADRSPASSILIQMKV